MAGYRMPYTIAEEKTILKYIIENEAYNLLRGDVFWKKMEEDKIVNRTWQSLKEHFRKRILGSLQFALYELSSEDVKNISLGYERGTLNLNNSKAKSKSSKDKANTADESREQEKSKKTTEQVEENTETTVPDFLNSTWSSDSSTGSDN